MIILNNGPRTVGSTALATLLVGYFSMRAQYNASTNLFPSTSGRGTSGVPIRGDAYYISTAGVLGGVPVPAGKFIMALTNTPGQTPANWVIFESGWGFDQFGEATIDITGLTALNLASYNGYSVINLTSSNATESLTQINGVTGKQKIILRPESGLIVTFGDKNNALIASGNIHLAGEQLVVDGTWYGFLEVQLRAGEMYQTSSIDSYNPIA